LRSRITPSLHFLPKFVLPPSDTGPTLLRNQQAHGAPDEQQALSDAMSKRVADKQINSQTYNPDAEVGAEPEGSWKRADESVLAERKIRKAKRPARGSESLPTGAAPDAPKANPFASVMLTASASSVASSGGFSFAAPPSASSFGSGAAAPTAGGFSFGGVGGAPASAPTPTPAPATGGFSFGVPATAPAAAVPASAPAPASALFGGFGGGGGFGSGSSAAPAPTPAPTPAPAPAPAPAAGAFSFGVSAAAAPASANAAAPSAAPPAAPPAASGAATSVAPSGGAKDDLVALNKEFLAYIEGEFAAGARACDWSAACKDYIAQRDSLRAGGAKSTTAAAAHVNAPASTAPGMFAFGGAGPTAPAPTEPKLAPAPAAPTPGPSTSGGSGGDDADVKFSAVTSLKVFRAEKKTKDGELISAAGWKAIGKGQLRIMHADGVHFVEFRPEVSDGSASQDPEDEMVGKKRFGRPVLSASLRKETKFEVTKNKVTVNLLSQDASGTPVYAKYYIPFATEELAGQLAATAKACAPC
jgi:hypothetical protein